MDASLTIPIQEINMQKTADILADTLADLKNGFTMLIQRNDFIFVVRNNTRWKLIRSGGLNDSSAWPIEDIDSKNITINSVLGKSFSFVVKYDFAIEENDPVRDPIIIGGSYPLIGSKKIVMNSGTNVKDAWQNMNDGMDKSVGKSRAYIIEEKGIPIWIFEIN